MRSSWPSQSNAPSIPKRRTLRPTLWWICFCDVSWLRVEENTIWRTTIASSEHTTGTKDEQYNLISVLYHTLQGAEASEQYLHLAQQAGHQKLVQFLREVQATGRAGEEGAATTWAQ